MRASLEGNVEQVDGRAHTPPPGPVPASGNGHEWATSDVAGPAWLSNEAGPGPSTVSRGQGYVLRCSHPLRTSMHSETVRGLGYRNPEPDPAPLLALPGGLSQTPGPLPSLPTDPVLCLAQKRGRHRPCDSASPDL